MAGAGLLLLTQHVCRPQALHLLPLPRAGLLSSLQRPSRATCLSGQPQVHLPSNLWKRWQLLMPCQVC